MKWLALPVLVLCGCTAVGPLTDALEKPVAAAKRASDTANETQKDIVRAYALGALATTAAPADYLCLTSAGPDAVTDDLGVFTDSLETIKKVGEKPSDTSYAGYIRKFAENEKAADRDIAKEKAEAAEEKRAAAQRCKQLALADLRHSSLVVPPVPADAVILPGLGSVLALDKLVKSVLAAVEAGQREQAVRQTIGYVIPQMKEAIADLRNPPVAGFGPVVHYDESAPPAAVEMNKTRLGATITIHRWFTAQRAKAALTDLAACKSGAIGNTACLDTSDKLVDAVAAYHALASIDTDKTLKALDGALASTQSALDSNAANFLDGLLAIASALGDIKDKRADYRKTR